MKRNCPSCPGTLSAATSGDVRREQCDACGGFWFERAALETLLGRELSAFGMTKASARICPNTGEPLVHAHVEGAFIEGCLQCGGVFVEATEFERLTLRAGTTRESSAGSLLEALGWWLLCSGGWDPD